MRGSMRPGLLILCGTFALVLIAVSGLPLWLGVTRGEIAGTAALGAFVLAAFLLLITAALFWLVLDQRIARPADRLAATLRVRAEGGAAHA
ncbi:3'-5' exonuclease, partial [Litorisediminicola beolgyonensis]